MLGHGVVAVDVAGGHRAMTKEQVDDAGVASMRAQPKCSSKPTRYGFSAVLMVRPLLKSPGQDTT
jgi:hypothetical protein